MLNLKKVYLVKRTFFCGKYEPNSFILPAITVLIFLTTFSAILKADKFSHDSEVVNNMPMSKMCIPPDREESAKQRTEKILRFFKTPQQQFMPLGMYNLNDDSENVGVMRNLRIHGINLIHKYGSASFTKDNQGILNAARNAGIGVMQDISGSLMRGNSPQWFEERIRAIARDKQLMLWYLPEETQATDLAKMQMLAETIRREDLYNRPIVTWQPFKGKNATLTYWQSISKITDAMIRVAYPCYESNKYPRAEIKSHIDFSYESGALVIFSGLEAFNGETFDNGWVIRSSGKPAKQWSIDDGWVSNGTVFKKWQKESSKFEKYYGCFPDGGQWVQVDRHNRRWPTPKEIRFDAYLSLISGAKGLFWYSHAYIKANPVLGNLTADTLLQRTGMSMDEWKRHAKNCYDMILEISHQLNGPSRLGEVFLMGEKTSFISCSLVAGKMNAPLVPIRAKKNWWKKPKRIYLSLQWLALKHKNAIYIFAVNMNEKVGEVDHGGKDYAITVKFKNLPDKIERAEVLFEDRKLTMQGNSFEDTFEPIGTHIYRFVLN